MLVNLKGGAALYGRFPRADHGRVVDTLREFDLPLGVHGSVCVCVVGNGWGSEGLR